MQDLVQFNSNLIPLVDSRLMSSRLDVRHRDMMRDILDKYSSDFIEFGSFARLLAKPEGGGRPQPYYLLNENQCYLLLTYIKNTPKARRLKQNLVQAFSDARDLLAQTQSARIEGKKVRRLETDSIKMLVDYASAKGSKSAERYYTNVTKMTNSLLGIEAGQRDNLSPTQLKQLSAIETIVDLAIRDGLKAELEYKDIYQLAKMRASALVDVLKIAER